jgi:hypothetical protein
LFVSVVFSEKYNSRVIGLKFLIYFSLKSIQMVEIIAPKLLDHTSNPKKMQLIAARVKLLASNLCKTEQSTAQHAHNRASTAPHQPKRPASNSSTWSLARAAFLEKLQAEEQVPLPHVIHSLHMGIPTHDGTRCSPNKPSPIMRPSY